MKDNKGFTVYELLFFIVTCLGVIGWINNIIKIASASFDPITPLLVLRFIGTVVAPLGAVVGFV